MTNGTVQNSAPSGGCWALIVLLVVIIFIASLGDSDSKGDNAIGETSVLPSGEWAEESTAAPSISQETIRQAARHAERAIGAMQGEGAMLYSETCQASLKRSFNIADYDRCYAFDLFAGRMLEIGEAYAVSHFSESSIRSRWSSASLNSSASATALQQRREAVAAAVSGIAVSPEAPPVPAAMAEQTMQDELSSSDRAILESEHSTMASEAKSGDELPSELEPIE